MPTTVTTARSGSRRDRAGVPARGVREPWQPGGTDEALAVMDRIARYCVYTCEPATERCIEDGCEAWSLERAAATYVMRRWVDAEG